MLEHWLERWRQDRTGWHETAGNRGLRAHWRATGRRVLVPLCGKSPDLVWLADRGNAVFGIEVSPLAVHAFFAEQQLDYELVDGELPEFRAKDKPITVFCGDFFELRSLRCDAHYDRGALVAMPAEWRPAYAAQVDALLEARAWRLVVTLEYDQSIADGPPYSVPSAELLSYWPGLSPLESRDDLVNGPPKFRDAGLDEMIETVWASAGA